MFKRISYRWTIAEVHTTSDDLRKEEDTLIDLAEHEQYKMGTEIRNDNILGSNIQRLFCESTRMKNHLTATLAQQNGILAAIAINLGKCQRIQAYGMTLIVEQCKAKTVEVKAHHTDKCGWEPIWKRGENEYTIARDGFTEIKYKECNWQHGIANFNSKIFQFINNTWMSQPPSIKIGGIGMQTHFVENIDKSINFLHNWENTLKASEIEQSNVFGEILTLLHHQEDKSSIAPLLTSKQEESRFPKIQWTFSPQRQWIAGSISLFIISAIVTIGTMKCILITNQENCGIKDAGAKYHQTRSRRKPI